MSDERWFRLRYSGINGPLLGLLGLGPRFTRVVVDDDTITVRMGWAFRACVARSQVRRVVATERPFIGWGVHGWRGRWLVNGSLAGIVSIEIDPPGRGWVMFVPVRLRTLYLSLADPDEFLAAAH